MKNLLRYIVGMFALLLITPLALADGSGGECGFDATGDHMMGSWGMGSASQLSTGMFGVGLIVHALIWLVFIALTVYIARKVWDAAAPKQTKKRSK